MNAKPQTILVVVPSLAGGGAERAVSWLTREWSREHRVVIAVFDASNKAYEAGGTLVDLAAAPVSGRMMRFYTGVRRVLRIRNLIREVDPDLIFGFMESANISLVLAALACGKRHRLTLSIRTNPERMGRSHKLLVTVLYPLAGRVAAVSTGVAESLARRLHPGGTRVQVLYSPLPLEEIRVLSEQSVDRHLVPPGVPYFFAAGRLVPGKDFARLIDLFAALCASLDGTDLRLLIAGEGPERGALQARIDALEARGLGGRVRLLGRVENPFAFTRAARGFLMTSRHEGFPMALIEAMACGCPMIAFDCDFGPAEAVGAAGRGEGSGPGFVVPLHDDAAFVASMRLLATDDALRARMGAAARARAADFDAATIASGWLKPPVNPPDDAVRS